MRIGIISTYPPTQCGIASYTQALAKPLGPLLGQESLVILADQGPDRASSPWPILPCFRRGGRDYRGIVEAAAREGVTIAHVQHAPDLFGMGGDFLAMLAKLKDRGIRIVVTLHTVFTRWSGLVERKPFAAGMHRRLGQLADVIVIHHDAMTGILTGHGVPQEKIQVIPHGTPEPSPGDPARGRAFLEIDGRDDLLLCFGFIHVQKNYHVLLKAMPDVLKARPRTRLVIAGKSPGTVWHHRLYMGYLKSLVARLGLGDRVILLDRFMDEDEMRHLHAAARTVLLPYWEDYGSVSGVAHFALGMHCPVLCSRSIKFAEIADSISADLLIPTHDPKAWSAGILRLLDDDSYRESLQSRISDFVTSTSWPSAARQHVELYKSL